jgi:subtilisin family serine protease
MAWAGYLGPKARLAVEKSAPTTSVQPESTWIARFEGDPAILEKNGAKIVSHIGRVFVLQSKTPNLTMLSTLAGMLDIEEPTKYQTTLEVSSVDLNMSQTRQALGLDGEGALVAIIDTGLDIRHEDFRNADGTSRVLFFLDLNQSPEESRIAPVLDTDGTIIEGLGGTVYDNSLLNQFLQGAPLPIPKDTIGHGTHVAGIAAANGRATGLGLPAGRYVGMAPGADLLIVDADPDPGSFTDADLITALQFVTERAQKLGRPVVINMSLGGQSGPHDGTGPVEEAIDSISGSGKEGVIVVLSAGNDGARDLHASGKIDGESEIEVLVPPHLFFEGKGSAEFDLSFDKASGLSLSVISPTGEVFGPISSTGKAASLAGTSGVVDLAFGDPTQATESAFVHIKEDEVRTVADGVWRIVLSGRAARYDLWMSRSTLGATRLQSPIDSDVRVSTLACANSAIAVASHVNREFWLQPDAEETHTGLTLQEISTFSSFGPTRTGGIRPDLSGPGEFVLASLSQDAPPTLRESAFFAVPADLRLADDGKHGAQRGTSMSAPHVTGVIALLLSIEPRLDAEEVRRILWLSAKADAKTTQTLPDHRWGFGKLDPFAAAQILLQATPQALSTERSTVGASLDLLPPDGSVSSTIYVIPRDINGVPMGSGHTVTLLLNLRDSRTNVSLAQRSLPLTDEGDGIYSALLFGESSKSFGDAPLIADLRAQFEGIELEGTPSIAFAFDRREIGRLREFSGGSCQVSPVGEPGSLLFLGGLSFLLSLLISRQRGRRSRA